MTKTPDEIKKGLECCVDGNLVCAGNCVFDDDVKLGYPDCVKLLMTNALALIQQKEQENAEQAEKIRVLEARVRQLEAERDAAVAGLKSNCTCPECKYFSDEIQDPCRGCKPNDSKFEWRGVQKEDSDDGKE